MGTKKGEVIVASLQSGCVVGKVSLEGHITSIQICKDDTALDLPPVFILVGIVLHMFIVFEYVCAIFFREPIHGPDFL